MTDERRDYEKERKQRMWAKIGKSTAVIGGLGAAIAALYGIGSTIYTSGREDAESELKRAHSAKVREVEGDLSSKIRELTKQLKQAPADAENALNAKLTREGRLIPEGSCLRYGRLQTVPNTAYTKESIIGAGACKRSKDEGGLVFGAEWSQNDGVRAADLIAGNRRARYEKPYSGTEKVDLFDRQTNVWVPAVNDKSKK